MSWSIKLGTIKGIEIRVHVTFFLILIWAAAEGLSQSDGGWGRAIFGVLSTCLLFVCVVLHELGGPSAEHHSVAHWRGGADGESTR